MQTHTLVSSHWRVEVDPANGMGWLSGKAFHAEQWLDLLPDCTEESAKLGQCNFLLLPYSNRIRDAKFEFEGQSYQLANAERHAIHGVVRKLPWAVTSKDSEQISAVLDTRDHNEVNWPWPFLAKTQLRVHENQLISTLHIQNLGESNMPVGGGWHPYFVRHLKQCDPRLTVPVTGYYPDTNGDCLPTSGPEPIPAELNFNNTAPLPEHQRIDHCFAGLHGSMQIVWPDVDLTLTLRCSDQMGHAILYNPDAPHFALEPVSHANDAVNLMSRGIDAGLQTLAPRATWEDTLVFEYS